MQIDINRKIDICFQDEKFYSQKFNSKSTRYKPVKQQYIIYPPSVERTLPNRSEIIPKDAVWQNVHSTKYHNPVM